MKKLIFSIFALCMIIMLTACSDKDSTNSSSDQEDEVERKTEEDLTLDKANTLETVDLDSTENTLQDDTEDIEEIEESEEIDEPEEVDEVETEDTGKTIETYGDKPDFGKLSDDVYSFQVEIDGELYQFPMKYTDFISYGWKYNQDDTEKLDSNYLFSAVFYKGKLECYVDIVNFDINALPISECYVSGISIDSVNIRDAKKFSLRLPKGLEHGKATVEDIKEAYGTPSYIYVGEYFTRLTYEYDYYQEVDILVSKETASIKSVDIQNASIPDDFVVSEVSMDMPEIVKKYKAPDKLGDSFDAYIVKYGGELYQLPAPVSTFISNGWKIKENSSDMLVAGRSYGWVTIINDNQELKAIANNYSEDATSIENCFLTSVKSGDNNNKTDIMIPRDITIGMSESNLEKALNGVEYEKYTSSTSYNYYCIVPGRSKLDLYEIYSKNNAIYKIEVSNSPKYSDYVK